MSSDQVEVYRALNDQHAQLVKNLLESEGIWSVATGAEVQGALGLQGMAWEGSPRVYVRLEDERQARMVVEDFENSLKDSRESAAEIDEFDEYLDGQGKSWDDWPICPGCRMRRRAVCPDCETFGDDFELAEFVVDHKGTLITCPNCDENFTPQFVRECHNCTHDFGNGVELVVYDQNVFNHRAIVLALVLGVLGVLGGTYFLSLLH